MAYVGNQQTPDQEQNLSAPAGTTSANPLANIPPSQTGGSAGAGTGGGGSPNVGTSKQFGAPASKLGDYLSANAPQIQGQANKIAGNLTNQYGQVSGDVSNAANQFGQQVASGYTAPNQDLVNQATANPSGFVANPSNVSGFQAQLNDTYTGPQNFESTAPYANVQNEVQNAVTNAGLWNTLGGVASAVQASNPTNAQGINTLDSSLLQMSPSAIGTVQQAAQPFQNLPTYLQQAVTNGDMSVQQAQQAATGAAQNANTALTGAVSNLNTGITNQNNTAYNTANTDYQNLLNQLTAGTPNADLVTQANSLLQTPGHSNDAATAALNALKSSLTQPTAGGPVEQFSPMNGPQGSISPQQLAILQQEQNQLATPTFTNAQIAGNGDAWTQGQSVPLTQWLNGTAPTQGMFTGANTQDTATGNALNQLAGSNVWNAPAASQAYTAPTFDFGAANTALTNDLTQQKSGAQSLADFISSQQESAHAAGEQKGGVLGGLEQDITHPLSSIASLNPLTWGANIQNMINGKQVSPTNFNPEKPTTKNNS